MKREKKSADNLIIALIIPTILLTSVNIKILTAKRKTKSSFIIDYRKHLNKKFKKIKRKSTKYIIVHTSEAGKISTLRTLAQGKNVGRYRTRGGHAHYAISRDGKVFRILHHRYRADHAGLSMWNNIEDISSHSLGIELVGFHYSSITKQQYHSLSRLLQILKKIYRIPDKNVLTHCQVSYGKPNLWFKRPHRGRKRCALNFERHKAGLKSSWSYDPDVRAGRLLKDQHIHAMFYRKSRTFKRDEKIVIASKNTTTSPKLEKASIENKMVENIIQPQNLTNIISQNNTAWNIAGEDYDDSATLYVLPDNKRIRGHKIKELIGWNHIPSGTKVLLNQPPNIEKKKGPIYVVTKEYSAWSFAGADYSQSSTFYFLPDGRITPGNQMDDWDSIPLKTRMIIGYRGPYVIQNAKGKTPWGIAGKAHNLPNTIYFIPGQGVAPGNQIKDFTDLPSGSLLFLKNI